MTHATWALQSHDLSGEEINSGSYTYFFWPHKDMKGLPGWGISSMPGPPPRQHKHERRYTPFMHPFILTRQIWKVDYDGQMIFRGPCGPKASWHLSYKWGKTSPRKLVPTRDQTRAHCMTGAHATACSTAVDSSWVISWVKSLISELSASNSNA